MKYVILTALLSLVMIPGSFAEAVGGPKNFRGRIPVGGSASHSIEFVGGKRATFEIFCGEPCHVTLFRPDGSISLSKDASDNFDDGYDIDIEADPRENMVYGVVIASKAQKEFGYNLKTN